MPNTIDYASIFNQQLANKFAVSLRTANMESNMLGITWDGGKYVNIPSIVTQGLGTVSGCAVPDGDYVFDFEPHEMQWYRGRSFSIPRYAVNETNFALNVGNLLNSFVEQQVIPEVDKLRIGHVADKAITYTPDSGTTYPFVTYEGASESATPLKDLLDDIGLIKDRIGEDKRIICYISTKKKTAIMTDSAISKYLAVRDEERNGANVRIEMINDVPLIGVPSDYMHSKWTINDGSTSGQTAGGVVADDTNGKVLNWVLMAEGTAIAVGYPRVSKIISPDENQNGDCWKLMFTTYHGCFVPGQRIPGIQANVKGASS